MIKKSTLPLVLACITGITLASAVPLASVLKEPDSWFTTAQGKAAVANILSWQSPAGDWPKNQDNSAKPFSGKRSKLKGTFDNGATTNELRVLARASGVTGDSACKTAFLAGFDHILAAQYANGGWPQCSPPGKSYPRHITFNDNSMVRLLVFLREFSDGKPKGLLDEPRRAASRAAFDRGVDCILKCQIVINGKPTVWCAQHDEVSLAPAAARAYELPSLSGSESADILIFLMSLDHPSPAVVRAVKGGVAWFDAAKITGLRIGRTNGQRTVEPDPGAPPVWARFYDLKTGKPFFCDRDGVKKTALADIGSERRNGYAWYGDWGEAVAKAYAKWPAR